MMKSKLGITSIILLAGLITALALLGAQATSAIANPVAPRSWEIQTGESEEGEEWNTSLPLGIARRPHLSDYGVTNSDLRNTSGIENGWEFENGESQGYAGGDPSLASDTVVHPHISYYDVLNGKIKYAAGVLLAPDTITVNSTADELSVGNGECTLREAIMNANANSDTTGGDCVAGSGADTIDLPAGTYTLAIPGAGENNNATGDLDILDPEGLTIQGAGAEMTIIDGNQLDRVLHLKGSYVIEDNPVFLNDLTIANGYSTVGPIYGGGGVLNENAAVTLNNCVLSNNTNEANANLTNGGGLLNLNGPAVLVDTLVSENRVISDLGFPGGGVFSYAYLANASITLIDSQVISNTAPAGGGGGAAAENGRIHSMTISNTILSDNTGIEGGGLYVWAGTASDTSIVTIRESTIAANLAIGDGAFSGVGGGLYLFGSEVLIDSTTIMSNTGESTGGPPGTPTAGGGGIVLWEGMATVVNSTISGNAAVGDPGLVDSGFGGGLVLVSTAGSGAVYTLINTTVAGNSANQGAGGLWAGLPLGGTDLTVTFVNTLLADNQAPEGMGSNCLQAYGPTDFVSLGHNLEDDDTCEFDQPTDQINTDPLLGPLQDNGGPTWTHALLEASPAIDMADDTVCAADPVNGLDQRGVARPQGTACDIGAYELQPGVIHVNSTVDELSAGNGECTLREAIMNANANSDTTDGDCAAGSGDDVIILDSGSYTLTIPGANENANATGDLDVLDSLAIDGAGAENTIIDGNGLDRVLNLPNGYLLTLTLNNLTISGGYVSGSPGGGILNIDGSLVLNQSIVQNNVSDNGSFGGGGIASYGQPSYSSVILRESMLRGNQALGESSLTGDGGGAGIIGAEVLIDSSSVVSNTASGMSDYSGEGGGLLLLDSTTTVANSTISGNMALGNPSALYSGNSGGILTGGNSGTSVTTFINTTIAGNSANVTDGGITVGSTGPATTVYFANTIIAGNQAPASANCGDLDIGPVTWESLGHNLEDADTCQLDQPTDQVNIEPLLGPLQDNGGPTWTHALLEGSPAIDTADDDVCAADPVNGVDQRGVTRPQGWSCDIGAFELEVEEEPISGLTADNDSPTALGNPTTLTAMIESGTDVIYAWDFGDGATGAGAVVTHTYAVTGTYMAVVTATNPLSQVVATTTVIVQEPVSGLVAANDSPTVLGEMTTLTATVESGTDVSYSWDFGDGTTGTGASVSHTYAAAGTYTAVVTATNLVSELSTSTTVVIIPPPVPGWQQYLPLVSRP